VWPVLVIGSSCVISRTADASKFFIFINVCVCFCIHITTRGKVLQRTALHGVLELQMEHVMQKTDD